ncbi:MAG: chorismate mutase [Alphaproteobacteria bacterium]|nr:chorismate mutase [Alphaproteobacteria bacterium]
MSNKSVITKIQNQIGTIDAEILSLLVRRFEAVKALSVQENIPEDEISYRPDREAKVMRNAIEQNNGMLPVGSLSKIMREIISIEQQIHRAFNVAVYVKEQSQNMLELSKEHFGTNCRYIPCLSLSQTIQKVDSDEAGVAVLPLFDGAEESWWTTLSCGSHETLKIVAKLPFLKKNITSEKEAYVIGRAPFLPTGNDRTLFAIEMSSQTSIASLKSLLEEVGLTVHQVWPAYHLSRIYLFAVELDGYITPDDKRIVLFKKAQEKNVFLMRPIGGYAMQENLG